ncbi:MAG: hypothetical protein QOE53_2147, partial [Pseudonocardiales bacterium]|nr:hypothetical protein [Pseudonocardiales bacterium]
MAVRPRCNPASGECIRRECEDCGRDDIAR